MVGKQISKTHLEYVGGNSFKEYNVIVTKTSKINGHFYYNVYGLYGRIGNNLVEVEKASGVNNLHALRVADDLVNSKTKKGYSIITEDSVSKFDKDYVEELTQRAATLTAEGQLERNHYSNLKSMLTSPDEETLIMAEKIIIENEENTVANSN